MAIKNNKGVSLIELIVAITVFSILILSATQIFKLVVDGQRNSISAQNVQENIRYAMEKMSKEMRMAEISDDDCLASAVYKVFNVLADGGNDQLYFKNQYGECVVYYLDSASGRLKIAVDGGSGLVDDFITPSKIEISNLKFFVDDDLIGAFHGKQPRATMKMDIKSGGQSLHQQEIKIQLTVSSRYYE
ncbi:MAG: prepilin-type N-terminal cleavage/methylation domain-containing protein [bacterium]|nr:prepilin-type N-terminal cleavage/methylation domain-containing protein [bacterium]